MHPPGVLVEALVDEELAPGDRAIGVQSLVAGRLQFGAEEERSVRIDQQQGMTVLGVGRGDGEAVGAGRLFEPDVGIGIQHRGLGGAVEGFQLAERHPFDVAADAALAEAQGHPGLELGDDPRFHLRVAGEVEVQPVGPGVHQALQPGRAGGVLSLQVHRVNEQLHPQVAVDRRFALGFGQPSQRVDVVGLDAVEVVLGLGVGHAEHRVGVGFAMDVGDPPGVARDADLGGLLLQAAHLVGIGRRGGDEAADEQGQGQIAHGDLRYSVGRALRTRMFVRLYSHAGRALPQDVKAQGGFSPILLRSS